MMTIFYIHEESRFRNTSAAEKIRATVETYLDCGPLDGIFSENQLIRVDDPDSLLRTGLDSQEIVNLHNGIESRWVTLTVERSLTPEFGDPPIKLLIHDGGPDAIDHTPEFGLSMVHASALVASLTERQAYRRVVGRRPYRT